MSSCRQPGPTGPAQGELKAGPWRRSLEVTANEQIGPYFLLKLADPHGPVPQPGQFAMLAAARGWGGAEDERPYLPRAVSYARFSDQTAHFLLEPVGPGTERLCSMQPGEEVHALGPLGRGFSLPESDPQAQQGSTQPAPAAQIQPLLLGGGIGIAPLLILNDALNASAQSIRPRLLLGFRDGPHARAAELFTNAQVATDDGSRGRQGSALRLLEAALAEHSAEASAGGRPEGDGPGELKISACGPPGLLEAVRVLAVSHNLDCELALEAPMACGFGACYGCVQPGRDGRYLRTCLDGPVIDAALLERVFAVEQIRT